MQETRITAGNITFIVKELRARAAAGGGVIGVSVGVVDRQGEQDTFVIRFDWSPDSPHYHYNPGKKNGREIPLDPALVGDSMEWFLGRMPERLASLVDNAGYPDLAKGISRSDVTRVMPDVTRAANGLAESVVKILSLRKAEEDAHANPQQGG